MVIRSSQILFGGLVCWGFFSLFGEGVGAVFVRVGFVLFLSSVSHLQLRYMRNFHGI